MGVSVKAARLRLIALGVVYSVLTGVVTGAPNDVTASDSAGKEPRFSLTPLFGYRRNDTQVGNLNVGFGSNETVPTGFKFSNSSARHTSLDLQGEFRPWRFLRLYGIVGYDDRRSDMTVTTPEQSFTIPVVIEIPDIPDIELPPTAVPLVYYPELEEIIKLLEFCELEEPPASNTAFWGKVGAIGSVGHTNRYEGFDVVEQICRGNLQRFGYPVES